MRENVDQQKNDGIVVVLPAYLRRTKQWKGVDVMVRWTGLEVDVWG